MTPLPAGFTVDLDPSTRTYADVLVGGHPSRLMRLTMAGRAAFDTVQAGTTDTVASRELARRLIDAGMAHPRPPRLDRAVGITVIVPVRDRVRSLERCLAAVGPEFPIVVVDDGSHDQHAVAAVAKRHGATLIRHAHARGPGAARNAAVARTTTDLIAFIDSDCKPAPAWLTQLSAHFADPLVGGVAPRVCPETTPGGASWCERFAAARSPLDLGRAASAVVPGGRVSYVPTAALVVRRAALGEGFDPELRYGEDVDLVWRLHDAGWRIRYDPAVAVTHSEPRRWRRLLARRFRYGTSAAPLARRHPGRLAPLVARPAPTAAALLLLTRRLGPALVAVALHAMLLERRTRALGLPRRVALRWSAESAGWTCIGIGHAATIAAGPGLLLALLSRRARASAVPLILASPLLQWHQRRPPLDPVRWTLACVADDIAYGLGVWRGCLRERTLAPLLPRLSRTT